MSDDIMAKVQAARDRYAGMSASDRDAHDYAQRRSFVRGMCPDNTDFRTWCQAVDRALPPRETDLQGKEAEIAYLRNRLRQAESSLSTWDDDLDSPYWNLYPDAKPGRQS